MTANELKNKLEAKLNENNEGIRFKLYNADNAFKFDEDGNLRGHIYCLMIRANKEFNRRYVEKTIAKFLQNEGINVYEADGRIIIHDKKYNDYNQLYCNNTASVYCDDPYFTAVFADGICSHYVEEKNGKIFLCHGNKEDVDDKELFKLGYAH